MHRESTTMLANPIWQRTALLLNLLGTIVLFFSFQATSSDFMLVTAPNAGENRRFLIPDNMPPELKKNQLPLSKSIYALCINGNALFTTDAAGTVIWGAGRCPALTYAKPAAVVNTEHPRFEGFGFALVILGFGIQFLAIPKPETTAHLRAELKKLRSQERARPGKPS